MNSFGKQRTLAMMTGFERYTKKTRRAMFLEEMEQVVPWGKLCALIEPHCPKPGNGRRARNSTREMCPEGSVRFTGFEDAWLYLA